MCWSARWWVRCAVTQWMPSTAPIWRYVIRARRMSWMRSWRSVISLVMPVLYDGCCFLYDGLFCGVLGVFFGAPYPLLALALGVVVVFFLSGDEPPKLGRQL